MYKDSYNDYIRSVLGNSESNNEGLKYPDEDKSYYCDYSHPKNNMQQFDMPNNSYNQNDNQNYNMQDYNIMYSDHQNRYGMPNYYEYADYPNGYNSTETRANPDIEECYPEIYGVVYPMVQKACRSITEPVTKVDVEKMVEELYGSLEGNDDRVEQKQVNSAEHFRTNETNRNQMSNRTNRSTGLFKPNVEPKREVPIPPKVEQKQDVISNTNILDKTNESTKETRYCNNGVCDIIRILLIRELLGGPNKPGPRPPFRPGPRPPFGPYPPFGPGPRPPFGPEPRPPFYR